MGTKTHHSQLSQHWIQEYRATGSRDHYYVLDFLDACLTARKNLGPDHPKNDAFYARVFVEVYALKEDRLRKTRESIEESRRIF